MAITAVYLLAWLAALSLPGYALTAVSLYAIGNRRGVEFPASAWIPVARLWLIGCLSDQYRCIVCGKLKNKRTALLGLAFGTVLAWGLGILLGWYGMFLAAAGMAAAAAWLICLALWDLYVSCDPRRAALYLALSILVPYAMPVCLFLCRNKDLNFPL